MNYFFGSSHLKVICEHQWVLISEKSSKDPWVEQEEESLKISI